MKAIFAFFLLFLSTGSFCQSRVTLNEKNFDPSSFGIFEIKIKKTRKDAINVFTHNTPLFIDRRLDTTKIGFAFVGTNLRYHRMVFPESVARYFTSSSQNFGEYNLAAKDRIVFVLNDLWVSEAVAETKDFGRSLLVNEDYFTYCYLNADCYRLNESGKCGFIGTIDSVYSIRRWIADAADDLLKKSLKKTLIKADSLFIETLDQPLNVSFGELISKYDQEMKYQVSETSPLTRGIYASYDDFLNNRTSFPDFTITTVKNKEIVHSELAADSDMDKAWGYYDGENFKMHIGTRFYRMIRSDRTFDVIAPRVLGATISYAQRLINSAIASFLVSLITGHFMVPAVSTIDQINAELIPFQLQIRQGRLY